MKLFNMKTRKMVDKSFSQYLVYQAFQAVTHDIFNDKTWFPTSRCSCEDVFYEVFCIVDKNDVFAYRYGEPPCLCGRNRAI